MGIIDPPKKWAYLVAVGPASIIVGVLAIIMTVARIPAMEVFILWMLLSLLAVPAVIIGTLADVSVVESETGVQQKGWVWALIGLFLAPLAGTIYLWTRRKYFRQTHTTS